MQGALKNKLTTNCPPQYVKANKPSSQLRNSGRLNFQLAGTCFPTWLSIRRSNQVKVYAVRRRRANTESDTYVLMEPGKNEEFVSEDELKVKLTEWLENWPGKELPPDLAKFGSTEDAVSYLVKSVCELEIDGDVGSIQWFQVRLE